MPWLIDVITGTEFNQWAWLRDPKPPIGFCNSDFAPTEEEQQTPLHIDVRARLDPVAHYCRGPGKQGDIIVSREFKQKVEQLDPERHYSIPTVLHHSDGRIQEGTHFLFTLGAFVEDGIVVEQSEMSVHPRFDRYLSSAPAPRVMWRASKVKGRHIWADRRFMKGVVMSDQPYGELCQLGIGDPIGRESRIDDTV